MIELGFIAALIVGLNEMVKRYEYVLKRLPTKQKNTR